MNRRNSPPSILHDQPRRPVPWGIADVALVMIFYFVVPTILVQASYSWFDVSIAAPSHVAEGQKLDVEHPLARVLLESHNVWVILMCALVAVVVTPITEELVFRLLLQGWLESLERRFRPPWPIAAGVVPVLLSSLMFAALHIRAPQPPADISTIVFLLGVQAAASLLTVALLTCWLRFAVRATLADFGVVPGKLAADVLLGLLALLAVIVPVYAVLIAAQRLLPAGAVADPVPLLLLAAVLGTLYYRTHRIVPAIVLHTTFNAVAVLLAIGMR